MNKQLWVVFAVIGLIVLIPWMGIFSIDNYFSNVNSRGVSTAYTIHVIITFGALLLAAQRIKTKHYFWGEQQPILANSTVILRRMFHVMLVLVVIQYFLRGRAILGEAYRGDVRVSMGMLGFLANFIANYAVKGILALSSTIYILFRNAGTDDRRYFLYIVALSTAIFAFAGGKSSFVFGFLPLIIQVGHKMNAKVIISAVFVAALSVILMGIWQMNMSFTASIEYNIYRATALAAFGSAAAWDMFPQGSPTAYYALISGFGEHIASILMGVDRHSEQFLQFSFSRLVTYHYYGDGTRALDGSVNLTVTSFGETVYWFGHDYFFIASILTSFIGYLLLIQIFKTRSVSHLCANTMFSVFFCSRYLSWHNSSNGSFLSDLFGFTTIVYMAMLYLLLRYLLSNLKIVDAPYVQILKCTK